MMKFGLALVVVCSVVSSAKKSFFKEECKTDKLFNQWILDCFEDRDCKRCSSYFSNNATVMDNVYNWCNTFEDTTCSSLKTSTNGTNMNATTPETVSTMMYVPLYKSKPHNKVHSPLVNSKAVRDNTAVYFGSLWALSKECCQDLHAVTRKLSPKHQENAATDHHHHHVENGEEGGSSSSSEDFHQQHDEKHHHEKHDHHHEKHGHHPSNTTTASPGHSTESAVSNPAAMIVAELVDGVLLSNTSGGSSASGSSSSMGGLEHDLENTVLDLFAGGSKSDERELSKKQEEHNNKNNRMFPPHCRMEKETFAVVVESAVDEKNPDGQDVTTVFHELELFKKRKHMKKHSSKDTGRTSSSDEDESSSVDSTAAGTDEDDDVSVVMKKGWNLMASGNCSELEQLVDTKPVEVSQIIPMGYPYLSGSGLSGNVSTSEDDNSALNNFVSAMYALFPEDVRNTTLTVPMNSIAKYVCLMANATRQVEHARNIHISNMLVSTSSTRGISIVHFNDIKNQTVKSVISLVEYDPLSKKITKWFNYPATHEVHDAEYAKASLLSAFADPYDFSGEDNADIESASSTAANSSSMLVRAVLSVSGLLATVCMLWAWNIRNTKNSLASVRALQHQQPAYEALLP